jgi:hypothetical protein
MPNVEHIDEIIAAIQAEEIAKFDMCYWVRHRDCGTVACIAGFSNLILDPTGYQSTFSENCQALGISPDLGQELFVAIGSKVPLPDITPAMAIRALEDLKVDQFKLWDDYL